MTDAFQEAIRAIYAASKPRKLKFFTPAQVRSLTAP
mgnify:FL=1